MRGIAIGAFARGGEYGIAEMRLYFEVVYEYFDDVLRDRHREHELGMSFLQ